MRREEVTACVATSWMVSKPGPNDCVLSREGVQFCLGEIIILILTFLVTCRGM